MKTVRRRSQLAVCFVVLLVSTLAGAPARADDFYKGKTITLVDGTAAGDIYDFFSRLFASRLPDYIPGHPTIVVQNMPGAGGMIQGNYMYNVAPSDGTTIGVALNTLPLNEILSPGQAKYHSERFAWIGRAEAPIHAMLGWTAMGLTGIEVAKTREVLTGSTAPGTASQFYPNLANSLAGTRFKLVTGYSSITDIRLAMQRGELEASGSEAWASISNAQPEWVREKKIIPLFQIRLQRDPSLPNTPTLLELAHDDEARAVVTFITNIDAIGFNLMAPPGAPADRIAILRDAFMRMMADASYVSSVRAAGESVSPLDGAGLQKLVESFHDTPRGVVEDFVKYATVQP